MRKSTLSISISLLLVCSLLSTTGYAEDTSTQKHDAAQYLMIGGSQYSSESSYSYLGLIRPIGNAEIGHGWFQSIIGSRLSYQYGINENNQANTLKVKAPGIETGLGYSWSSNVYNLSLSMAVGYRYYNLNPYVSGEKPEGSTYNLTPQIQAGYNLTNKIDVGLLSNYSFGQQSNFNRLRLGYKPVNNWHVGLESMYQQGRNYRIKQQGIFATTYLDHGLSLDVSGGNLDSGNNSSTAYFGLAFSKFF